MSRAVNFRFNLIEAQQKPTDRKKNLRYNAFTSKAYAKNTSIDEIGKPPKSVLRKPISYHSPFKKDYLNGNIPLSIDHSCNSNINARLAWKESIQSQDLTDILPKVIYGLADCNSKFADLAELTLTYILNHAHRRQIYLSLPYLTRPFRFLFRSRNKYAITTGLKALENLVTSLFYAGRILMPEYEKIMSPLNTYLWGPEEKLCDDIFYGQWHNCYLSQAIETALRAIERSATGSSEQCTVYSELKKAVPLYESEVFPLKGNLKVMRQKNEISSDILKLKYDHGTDANVLNLRIIDANEM